MQTETMIRALSSNPKAGMAHRMETLIPPKDVAGTLAPATQTPPQKIYLGHKFAYTKLKVPVIFLRELAPLGVEPRIIDWMWHPVIDGTWKEGDDVHEHYAKRSECAYDPERIAVIGTLFDIPLEIRYTQVERRDWGLRKLILSVRHTDLKVMSANPPLDQLVPKIVQRMLTSHVILDKDGYQGVWYQLI